MKFVSNPEGLKGFAEVQADVILIIKVLFFQILGFNKGKFFKVAFMLKWW